MPSLTQRFINAVQWSVAISAATTVVQIGIMAIVARLLTPADFGVYAVANVALVIARHFGDRGLVTAIVREPALDREIIGSAVTLSCVLSASLALITFMLAPLAGMGSATSHVSAIEGLLRLISLSIFISGMGGPAQALMQRELRFRELRLLQAAGIVLGTGGVTIIFAIAGSGPWSLACGEIANTTFVTAGCWWTVRDRWSVSWHASHIMRIGVVGVQMTVLRVLDALWTQLPMIVANARLSPVDVGLYQRGQTLVDIGVVYTTGRVNSVLFPVLASRQDRSDLVKELIPLLVGLFSLFLFSAAAFIAMMAADVIKLVLGPGWEDAAGPLALIMLAFAILHISQPASGQLEVRAIFAPRMIGAGLGAAVVGLGSLLLIGRYGLIGIAVAAVISAVVTATINFCAAISHFGVVPRDILAWLIPNAGIAALLVCAIKICDGLILHYAGSPALRLAVMGMVAIIAVVTGFRLLIGRTRRQILAKFLSPGTSRLAMAMAKVFGLQPPAL
jgi:lipopolysaccharide exporter